MEIPRCEGGIGTLVEAIGVFRGLDIDRFSRKALRVRARRYNNVSASEYTCADLITKGPPGRTLCSRTKLRSRVTSKWEVFRSLASRSRAQNTWLIPNQSTGPW